MFSSPIVLAFIQSAAVPAIVATVILFLFGGMKDPWRARLQGLALAAAFVYGGYVLIGRLHLPPTDVGEALMGAAMVLGLFALWNPKPLGPRYVVRGLFVLSVGALLFWPLREQLAKPMYHRNLLAFFCLGLGVWSIVERCAGKVRPVTLALLPLIAATSVSFMLLFNASASLANLVTVLCALIGGIAVLAFLFPARLGWGAIIPFLSIFVIAFVAAGHFYLDINPWHMMIFCMPFLVLWIRDWLTFVPEKTVPEAVILSLISAAPLVYFLYGVFKKSGPLY